MGAVKEQKSQKMSPLPSAKLLLLPGCQLCFNHQLHLWRILLEHNLDLRPDLPSPLGQLRSLSRTQKKPLLLPLRNHRRGDSSGYSATPPARLPALLPPPAALLEDSSGAPR